MKPLFSGIFILLILVLSGSQAFPQCGVEAGSDTAIICGGNVQLNAEPKWEEVSFDFSGTLFSVFFTSQDTGYVVGLSGGDKMIKKTTDGGLSWIAMGPIPYADYAWDVFFTSSNRGFVACSDGKLLVTNNGGSTWVEKHPGPYADLNSIFFVDENTGYIVGSYGTTLKTIDGGETWTNLSETNLTLNHTHFTDTNTGYVVGEGGTILKTSDGGDSWQILNSGTAQALYSVYFTDANTGYAAGGPYVGQGILLKTADGGNSWEFLETGMSDPIHSVYFTSPDTGYVAGGGGYGSTSTIARTTDAGETWKMQLSDSPYSISNVFFPNRRTGYAVGHNFSNDHPAILKLSLAGNTYSWSPPDGLNDPNIPDPFASPVSSTTYTVTMTQPAGCSTTDTIAVQVAPLTVSAGTDTTGICLGEVKLTTTTNYTGSDPLIYSWAPAEGLDSVNVASPTATVNGDRTYTVSVSTQNGCLAWDTIRVSLAPMNPPVICYVGVYGSNWNILVWDKPVDVAIDSFYVYRETHQTGIYEKIGSTAYGDQSMYIDYDSHPETQSNKYTISIKDSCNLESDPSPPHKTMHLTLNQGQDNVWNLIWEPYEGFPVTTYYIYRGTSSQNLELIGSTSGISTQYSDFKAPQGYVYYQVEVVTPNPCNQRKDEPSVSRSNIATNNPYFGIDNRSGEELFFAIIPNPAQNYLTVKFPEFSTRDHPVLEIIGSEGRLIRTIQINAMVVQIDVSDLPSGVYIIRLIADCGVGIRRMVKE